MFANCLKNNHVNSLYYVYVLVLILHVPYGNHQKMLGLTCLNKFLCMYVCMYVPENPPERTLVPKPNWLLTSYCQDVLSRVEEVRTQITSVFGRILNIGSTKKVSFPFPKRI